MGNGTRSWDCLIPNRKEETIIMFTHFKCARTQIRHYIPLACKQPTPLSPLDVAVGVHVG